MTTTTPHPTRLSLRASLVASVLLLFALLSGALASTGGASAVHAAAAATPSPDWLRSVNISLYDTNDQFTNTPSVQQLVSAGHPAVVRMPLRTSIPDAYDLTTLQAIRSIDATPLVIINGAAVANNEPGDAHWLSLVASVFPGGVYVEYGNEEDLAGITAQAYTASWNSVVTQLAAQFPQDHFVGPVTAWWNPNYVGYFVQHASPAPYAVSWHEYVCSPSDSDAYCMQHIANWSTHVAQTRAAMGTAFATLPIWITEWNLDAFSDARYSNAAFIAPWVDAALNEWQTLASQGVAATFLYTADSHGDFGLVGNNNALTPEGTAFYAWQPSGGSAPPPSPTPSPSPSPTPQPPTPGPSPTPPSPTPSPTPPPVRPVTLDIHGSALLTGAVSDNHELTVVDLATAGGVRIGRLAYWYAADASGHVTNSAVWLYNGVWQHAACGGSLPAAWELTYDGATLRFYAVSGSTDTLVCAESVAGGVVSRVELGDRAPDGAALWVRAHLQP